MIHKRLNKLCWDTNDKQATSFSIIIHLFPASEKKKEKEMDIIKSWRCKLLLLTKEREFSIRDLTRKKKGKRGEIGKRDRIYIPIFFLASNDTTVQERKNLVKIHLTSTRRSLNDGSKGTNLGYRKMWTTLPRNKKFWHEERENQRWLRLQKEFKA